MSKIALFSISKNEEQNIGRMLSSVKPHVDACYITDTGSTDKTVEIAKSFGAIVAEAGDQFLHPLYEGGEPVFNFDEARNFAWQQIPKDFDYIIWLDCDDELAQGENIRTLLKAMDEGKIGMMYCRYIYLADFTPQGQIKNIIIEHLRERIIKNDDSCKWIGKLHETIIPQRPVAQTDTKDIVVIHHTEEKEMVKALYRNIHTLEEMVLADNGKDPRHVGYLAKTVFDLHEPMLKSYNLGLFKQYLETSGWGEERSQMWTYVAYIHLESGEFDEAISASLMSLKEDDKFPDTYVVLALSFLQKRDWRRALHWVRIASMLELPKSTLVITPRDLQVRILEIIFQASINTGRIEEARMANDKLLELFPEDQGMLNRRKALEEQKKFEAVARGIVDLTTFHGDRGNTEVVLGILNAIPPEIAIEPSMVALRNKFLPPKKWGNNEIALYCGAGFEKWDPESLKKGIGGSEAAVIYLMREFAKLGYKVTVFADPEKEYVEKYIVGNVTYKPWYYFNPADEFNILISWRNPAFFDLDVKAKKTLVWNHDIVNPAEYTPERVAKIDHILALSEWQAQPLIEKGLQEKVYVTRNGIPL